jgi:uncharacterized protein
MKVSGLGPKTFENCAGFVRVADGPEPLDDTLVHPESYDLAKWILKEFSWKLEDGKPANLPPRTEWRTTWDKTVKKAAKKFQNISEDRVFAVLENLIDSMTKEDPRLKSVAEGSTNGEQSSSMGGVGSCKPLPRTLTEAKHLEEALAASGPILGVIGTVRNVADFGVFIDIGGENDGLLHISKLGPTLQLSNILIGEQIGVDILSASKGKVSLGLHGCNFQPTSFEKTTNSRVKGSSTSRKGLVSTARTTGQKRSHHTKTNGGRKKQKTGSDRRRL